MMYDLNVSGRLSSKEKDRLLITKRCVEFGWDTIAWTIAHVGSVGNHTLHLKPLPLIGLEPIPLREAYKMREFVNTRAQVALMPKQLRQLSRLHVIVDEIVDCQCLNVGNDILKRFDIVSVCPGNARVFAYLCKTAQIDIISFDLTHHIAFPLNKKLIDEAVRRGIYFEIQYSPIISSQHKRREVLNGSRVLIQYLRGRNVILTSGADEASNIRSPLDIDAVGHALQLSIEQTRAAISANPCELLHHAASRRRRFVPIEVCSAADFLIKYPELNRTMSQSKSAGLAAARVVGPNNDNDDEDAGCDAMLDVQSNGSLATGSDSEDAVDDDEDDDEDDEDDGSSEDEINDNDADPEDDAKTYSLADASEDDQIQSITPVGIKKGAKELTQPTPDLLQFASDPDDVVEESDSDPIGSDDNSDNKSDKGLGVKRKEIQTPENDGNGFLSFGSNVPNKLTTNKALTTHTSLTPASKKLKPNPPNVGEGKFSQSKGLTPSGRNTQTPSQSPQHPLSKKSGSSAGKQAVPVGSPGSLFSAMNVLSRQLSSSQHSAVKKSPLLGPKVSSTNSLSSASGKSGLKKPVRSPF